VAGGSPGEGTRTIAGAADLGIRLA
jgi:hypothetical protein